MTWPINKFWQGELFSRRKTSKSNGWIIKISKYLYLGWMSFYHLANMYFEIKNVNIQIKNVYFIFLKFKDAYTHLRIYHLIFDQFEFQHICKFVTIWSWICKMFWIQHVSIFIVSIFLEDFTNWKNAKAHVEEQSMLLLLHFLFSFLSTFIFLQAIINRVLWSLKVLKVGPSRFCWSWGDLRIYINL